jgi:predicted CXXCH cytochrome family protein
VPTLLPDVLDLKIRAEEDIQPTEPFDVTTFPGVPEFSVEPLLPDGLSIDPATGVISGAPAAAQPRQDYVISARIGTLVATSALSVAVSCWDETASGSDCVPAPLELGGTPAYPGGGPQMQLFGFSIANNPFHKQFDSTTTDTCASCHRAHTDKWQTFVPGAQSVSELCFTCHDGTGAPNIYNVQAEYTGATPNDSATRSYFSHDAVTSDAAALQSNPHFSATVGPDGETVPSQEFEAVTPAVTNRHSQCTDCHNPHFADATKLSAPTPTGSIVANAGWTASTLINGASGVSVNNALPAPDKYALLGAPGDRTQLEYQLCFKCHSGYTNLPANNGKPSQDYIDKAVELDPNNGSFHPVEGPGTNNTPDMAASLAGASPYKLWTFNTDQTVRCTNCHSGPDKTAVGTAAQVSPTHVSTNRGILILNYRDRNLRPVTNTYDVSDFALCFGCHTDTPMSSQTGTATNFRFHGKHVSGLGEGSGAAPGPSIDTPGAGKGDALCAECHFRIHSPVTEMSESGGTQTLSGTRLVSFSPNVEPVGGVLSWTSTGVGRGSCTLRCHGYTHNNKNYIP